MIILSNIKNIDLTDKDKTKKLLICMIIGFFFVFFGFYVFDRFFLKIILAIMFGLLIYK